MNLFFFTVAVIGLSHIFVDSKIMLPLRDFLRGRLPQSLYFLDCYQCTGFWCGLACGLMLLPPGGPWWSFLLHVAACGFAGSFLATFGALLLNYLEAQTIIHLDPKDKNE